MKRPVVFSRGFLLAACLHLPAALLAFGETAAAPSGPDDPAAWTIHVLNDNCPDYTWGLDEQQTRKAFADIVRAHLDEMTRTDGEPPEGRDRYNMAVTMEALCFLEQYPGRAAEFVQRVKEGRLYMSPFLCNTLWGFHSTETALRAMYPARRLAAQWGVPLDCAHHIEEPSLPWGMATILAGSGIRWLLVPYYDYDSTFGGFTNPPVFHYEGPDGSRIKTVMDPWLCRKASYAQGAAAIKEGGALVKWVEHYLQLGADYPLRVILASGTHSDISPTSGTQARGFAERILKHNAEAKGQPRLVNSTLPMFCQAADAAALPAVRGCFGHAWDLWPVSLAKYAAAMREGERKLLAAEALLAAAGRGSPDLLRKTQEDRRRAEWCLAMLADHAWNGTDERNRKVNADLRKGWAEELDRLSAKLLREGASAAGSKGMTSDVVLFNPLSTPQGGIVRVECPDEIGWVTDGKGHSPVEPVEEDGRQIRCFDWGTVPGFGFTRLTLKHHQTYPQDSHPPKVFTSPIGLDGYPFKLTLDPRAGGLTSLVHKPSGKEWVRPGRIVGLTIYNDGKDSLLTGMTSEVASSGLVNRLRLTGSVAGISCSNLITYNGGDRIDFDFRIRMPASTRLQRLCHAFPLLGEKTVVRVETPAAVVRPTFQPEGDLLPGADTKRVAVQGFVDVDGGADGATIAPLDAFCLRTDLEGVTFETLGNDQNYKEVKRDQNGETEFRFRYALRLRAGEYDQAEAVAFARTASMPLLVLGPVRKELEAPPVTVPRGRAVATCLKPADDEKPGGVILRVWETAGKPEPVPIGVPGFRRAVACDLLERDQGEIPVEDGTIRLKVRPYGLAAVRLIP